MATEVKPRRATPRATTELVYGKAQSAILAATEELLQERPLNELSVTDIVKRAGISRTSFYAHFSSKTAVIGECLRRVMHQVLVAVDPFLSPSGGDPEAAIRISLEQWVALCAPHGALLRAVSEEWPHDEQLRRLWFQMLATVTERTARVIRCARRSGQAPPGADPDALAACLMWAFERIMHVALIGDAPGLPGPEMIVEPLSQMVLGGLYGRPLAGG